MASNGPFGFSPSKISLLYKLGQVALQALCDTEFNSIVSGIYFNDFVSDFLTTEMSETDIFEVIRKNELYAMSMV